MSKIYTKHKDKWVLLLNISWEKSYWAKIAFFISKVVNIKGELLVIKDWIVFKNMLDLVHACNIILLELMKYLICFVKVQSKYLAHYVKLK